MASLGQGLVPLLMQGLTPLIWNLMTFRAGPSRARVLTASLGKGNTKCKGECKGVQNRYNAQQVVFHATFYCSLKTPALRLGQVLWRMLCASVTQREEAPRKSCLAGCSPFGDISVVDEQGAK